MKEIHGKKVMLKEATEKDIDELYFWKFEEEKQEAKKWNGPYIHETKVTKAEYHREWSDEGILPEVPSALIIEADQQLIGYVGAYWIDKNTNWLETGIVIYDSGYWNGGYGSEAYKLWIDYLFEATNLHRIGMSTWSGNDRMIKVAQKLGMKEEARIRRARVVDNTYYDAVKMGILREEWDGGS